MIINYCHLVARQRRPISTSEQTFVTCYSSRSKLWPFTLTINSQCTGEFCWRTVHRPELLKSTCIFLTVLNHPQSPGYVSNGTLERAAWFQRWSATDWTLNILRRSHILAFAQMSCYMTERLLENIFCSQRWDIIFSEATLPCLKVNFRFIFSSSPQSIHLYL